MNPIITIFLWFALIVIGAIITTEIIFASHSVKKRYKEYRMKKQFNKDKIFHSITLFPAKRLKILEK